MTPQLYNEVNDKLAAVWGSYAGWAHSVSLNDCYILRAIIFR